MVGRIRPHYLSVYIILAVTDDFYRWLKYDELLKIADHYLYKVLIKGSHCDFVAD